MSVSSACAMARAKLASLVANLKDSPLDKAIAAERTFAIGGTRTVVKDAITKTLNTIVPMAQRGLLEVPLDVAQASVRAAYHMVVDGSEFSPDLYRTMASTLGKDGLAAMKQGFQTGLNKTVEVWRNGGVDPDAVSRGFPQRDWGSPLANTIMNAPTQAISATARPLYEAAKQVSIYNDAALMAMREGGSKAIQTARINQLLANPTQEMMQRSLTTAAEAVFQNETGLGAVASRLRDLTRNLGKPTIKNPEGDRALRTLDAAYRLTTNAMLPVAKVPGAVVTKGLVDLTPMGLIIRPLMAATGERGATTIKALANAGVGSLLIAKGYIDAKHHEASGLQSTSRSVDNVTTATGSAIGAIKVAGKWVGIRALLGPYAIPYLIGNGIAQAEQLAKGKVQTPGETAKSAVASGFDVLTQETFLENLGRVGDAVKQGNLGQAAAGMVPVPQILRQVAQAVGPSTKRISEGPVQSLTAQTIPGVARTRPEAHDGFGRPMASDLGGVTGVAQAFLDPSRMTPDKSDAVTNELQRLGVGIASPASSLSNPNPDQPRIKLRAKARDDEKAQVGPMLHTQLETTIADPEYQRAPDAIKAKILKETVSAFHTIEQASAKTTALSPQRIMVP